MVYGLGPHGNLRGRPIARTVTWDELRDLAAFEAEKGRADQPLPRSRSAPRFDGRRRGHATQLPPRRGARADGANRRGLTHDQRQALEADFDRIRRFFGASSAGTGRTAWPSSVPGSTTSGALPLTEPVPDEIKISERLYLAPLVPLVGRGEGALVVVVSREQGADLPSRGRAAGGGRRSLRGAAPPPRPGRMVQSRFQRHVDELAQGHCVASAEAVDRLGRRLRWPRIVVVASEEAWERVLPLSPRRRGRRRGRDERPGPRTAGGALALTTPVLERWRAERESEVVERWREEAGRNGRAAAAGRRRSRPHRTVESSCFSSRTAPPRPARRCPACGRVAVEDQVPTGRDEDGGLAGRPRSRRPPDARARRHGLGGAPSPRPGPRRRNRRAAPLLVAAGRGSTGCAAEAASLALPVLGRSGARRRTSSPPFPGRRPRFGRPSAAPAPGRCKGRALVPRCPASGSDRGDRTSRRSASAREGGCPAPRPGRRRGSGPRGARARRAPFPPGEYLTAFSSRFASTCRTMSRSAATGGSPSSAESSIAISPGRCSRAASMTCRASGAGSQLSTERGRSCFQAACGQHLVDDAREPVGLGSDDGQGAVRGGPRPGRRRFSAASSPPRTRRPAACAARGRP